MHDTNITLANEKTTDLLIFLYQLHKYQLLPLTSWLSWLVFSHNGNYKTEIDFYEDIDISILRHIL